MSVGARLLHLFPFSRPPRAAPPALLPEGADAARTASRSSGCSSPLRHAGAGAPAERVCRPPRHLRGYLSPRAGCDGGPRHRLSARWRPRPRPLPPAAPPGVLGRGSAGRSDGGRGAGGGAGLAARLAAGAHLSRWRSGSWAGHLQRRNLCLGGAHLRVQPPPIRVRAPLSYGGRQDSAPAMLRESGQVSLWTCFLF